MRRRRVGQIEVRREQWEGHEKVLLRGFDAGDTAWVLDRVGGPLNTRAGSSQFYMLARGIVSWTLTNEQGIGMPWPQMKPEDWDDPQSPALQQRMASLKELMQEDINFLTGKLNELNAPNTKEEQEAFLAHASGGSVETAPSAHPLLSTAI